MKSLIDQAFLHMERISQHVLDGRYDLIGPDGEVILPQLWEQTITPDLTITMKMWPLPEFPAGPASPSTPPIAAPRPAQSEMRTQIDPVDDPQSNMQEAHGRKSLLRQWMSRR